MLVANPGRTPYSFATVKSNGREAPANNNCSSSTSQSTNHNSRLKSELKLSADYPSSSTQGSLFQSLTVNLNRASDFTKQTVQKLFARPIFASSSSASLAFSGQIITVPPTEIHRAPSRAAAESVDSLTVEMCHFKPIKAVPRTTTNKKSHAFILETPTPKRFIRKNVNNSVAGIFSPKKCHFYINLSSSSRRSAFSKVNGSTILSTKLSSQSKNIVKSKYKTSAKLLKIPKGQKNIPKNYQRNSASVKFTNQSVKQDLQSNTIKRALRQRKSVAVNIPKENEILCKKTTRGRPKKQSLSVGMEKTDFRIANKETEIKKCGKRGRPRKQPPSKNMIRTDLPIKNHETDVKKINKANKQERLQGHKFQDYEFAKKLQAELDKEHTEILPKTKTTRQLRSRTVEYETCVKRSCVRKIKYQNTSNEIEKNNGATSKDVPKKKLKQTKIIKSKICENSDSSSYLIRSRKRI